MTAVLIEERERPLDVRLVVAHRLEDRPRVRPVVPAAATPSDLRLAVLDGLLLEVAALRALEAVEELHPTRGTRPHRVVHEQRRGLAKRRPDERIPGAVRLRAVVLEAVAVGALSALDLIHGDERLRELAGKVNVNHRAPPRARRFRDRAAHRTTRRARPSAPGRAPLSRRRAK